MNLNRKPDATYTHFDQRGLIHTYSFATHKEAWEFKSALRGARRWAFMDVDDKSRRTVCERVKW